MSGGSAGGWTEQVGATPNAKKSKNGDLPLGMSPAQFLLFYIRKYKEQVGIKDKAEAKSINPGKVLQSLKNTEKKIKQLDEERNRFQTQDVRLYAEWKKGACAKELETLNLAVEGRKAAIEELRKLEQEYKEMVEASEQAAHRVSGKAKKQDREDELEDLINQMFSEGEDDEGDDDSFDNDGGFGFSDFDDDPTGKYKDHFEGKFNEINFLLFYETTGWTEDFLREVSKLPKTHRKKFVSVFHAELVSSQGGDLYSFYILVNRHADRLLELDEALELNLALQSGDTTAQIRIYHRKLVRELHPDLRGENPPKEFEKDLFTKVQEAYERADLAGLKRAEIDLALFRGKVSDDADPRLLKKLQQEKAEALKKLRKDLTKMKKNVEWNFEARSHAEKQSIKTEIKNQIKMETFEATLHKQWIKEEIKRLQSCMGQLSQLPLKMTRAKNRARPR